MTIAYFANPQSIHDCKWINALAAKYSVIIICPTENHSPYKWLSDDVKVFAILSPYSVLKFTQTNNVLRAINEVLRDNSVTIVHSMYAVPNAIWAHMSNCKNHIVTTRGSDILVDYSLTFARPEKLQHYFSYPRMRSLIKAALNKARFVTSTSKRQCKVIKGIVQDPTKCYVVRTGVDINKFSKSSSKSPSTPITIFCPRSMKPIYNIGLLVRSIDFLKKSRNINVKLRLLNDQPKSEYANQIEELIENKDLKNEISLLPPLSQEEMVAEYTASDIIIMIPSSDGTPVSGIEAMLAKRPLIVGPIPYDTDLFNEDTCWQTSEFTTESIGNCINLVIMSLESQKKTEKAFRAAIELADLNKSVAQIDDLYQQMIRPTV